MIATTTKQSKEQSEKLTKAMAGIPSSQSWRGSTMTTEADQDTEDTPDESEGVAK